jgi:hypothetical protein
MLMNKTWMAVLLALACAACAQLPGEARGAGSRHTHRFTQPPEKAAQCFARNAEEHSSALVAEVLARGSGQWEVVVRVKNGVLYAGARLERAGTGSSGAVTLMVTTTGRRDELLRELVEGC